jgi:hypothetical protein
MHLVRGLCARVLQNMMADLRKEVHRRSQLEAAQGAAAVEFAAVKHAKGKGSKKVPPSMPVASITASSMYSSRSSSGSWGDDALDSAAGSRSGSGSSSSSSGGGGGFLSLPDLLAAAVPLEITIRL